MASHLNTANSRYHYVIVRHFRFQKCLPCTVTISLLCLNNPFFCKKTVSQAAFIHLYVLMHLAWKTVFLRFIITLMSSSCTHKPFAYALHCMLLQAVYFIPIKIFSSVIGSSLILTPTALYTAFAIAGDGVLITISPMDFAPNGPVGS